MGRASPAFSLDSASWNRLWKLRIQDRLHLMLWKVASGTLKTKGALGKCLNREDEPEFLCPLFHLKTKDSIHLLLRCLVACMAWRESNWAVCLDLLPLANVVELIDLILNVDSMLSIKKDDLSAFTLNAAIVMDVL